MQEVVFSNISKIIERDSKVSTYKYALLRGAIDIIQDNSPYISFSDGRIHIPTGLLIEKWILYYYPILESPIIIPQINGDVNLAFGSQLNQIISTYRSIGGFSAFYNDLKNRGITDSIKQDFIELAKKLQETITKMPMRYIGRSISNDFYSIFNYQSGRPRKNTSTQLISNF